MLIPTYNQRTTQMGLIHRHYHRHRRRRRSTLLLNAVDSKNNNIRFIVASARDYNQTTIITTEEKCDAMQNVSNENNDNNNRTNNELFWKTGYMIVYC